MDRLAAAIQPLSVLVVTNLFGAAAALLQMLWVRNKDERSFARAALVLLVSLDVFAFLSGFSIGGWVALATVPIGVVLGLLARQYRAQIAAATAVNLLMFLATGLHWQAAAGLYRGAPLALMALGGIGLARTWADPRRAGGYGFALAAGLAFQALVNDGAATPALAALGLAGALAVISRQFRWEALLLAWGSLLWVLNLVLQG